MLPYEGMSKKSTILIILAIIGIGLIAYVVIILKSTKEVDEPSPLEEVMIEDAMDTAVIDDAMDSMDAETKAEFEKAVDEMKDVVIVEDEIMPEGPRLVAEGTFKPRAHNVEGNVLLIEHGGEKVLRFENFDTINGPNLHIYLSSGLGVSDAIDLGKIRATQGNINYEIDPTIDTNKYNKVLVWCVPFHILFSYAELK